MSTIDKSVRRRPRLIVIGAIVLVLIIAGATAVWLVTGGRLRDISHTHSAHRMSATQ